jgi:hypothetical protein
MSSSIPHVIGTMALLMCSIFVVTSFILLGLAVQIDLVKPQLQEVAEYVASTLVDLITLANQTDAQPLLLVKELRIPSSVAERGFTVTLVDESGDLCVHVCLTFLTTVSAEAPINVRTSHEVIMEKPSPPPEGFPEELFRATLYSGLEHPVVWCFKDEKGIIYIGLGVWSEGSMYAETAFPVASLKYGSTVDSYMCFKRVVEACTL